MIVPRNKFLEEVKIVPTPDSYQANIAAVDLRVGRKIYWPASQTENELVGEGQPLIIQPGVHFLIQSLEYFEIPDDMMAVVYPRSGTNRKGITVDMTGVVDPGYKGHLMIPVTNLLNVDVSFYPGERIAQICFHRIEKHDEELRESKYHNGGMEVKADKKYELDALMTGTLFREKVEELNAYEKEGKA